MTELRQLYKCEICGNVVEIVQEGAPALVCCDQKMDKLEPKTVDEGNEKHVPVIEKSNGKVLIKVGDVPHPMQDNHYIKFIEVLTDDRVLRVELEPDSEPEAEFDISKEKINEVREFCTVHDLWKSE